MATNIGKDSIGKPPPKFYRRFENAMLIILIPAIISMIQSWHFTNEMLALRLELIFSTGITAAVKGIGMIIGNNEIYVDPTTNNITPKEPDQKVQ